VDQDQWQVTLLTIAQLRHSFLTSTIWPTKPMKTSTSKPSTKTPFSCHPTACHPREDEWQWKTLERHHSKRNGCEQKAAVHRGQSIDDASCIATNEELMYHWHTMNEFYKQAGSGPDGNETIDKTVRQDGSEPRMCMYFHM
jgi:hypothetical protein